MKGGDTRAKAAANGKRVGRPAKPAAAAIPSKDFAARVLARIAEKEDWRILKIEEVRSDEDYAVYLISDAKSGGSFFEGYREKRDGLPMRTVNHLHDKPQEHLVTHTISERWRIALEKAEARVRARS